MVAIKKLFLFAAPVLSAAIEQRQQSTIFSDLQLVNSDVTSLDGTVNSFSGTNSQAIAVQNAYSKLDNDIKSATTRANNSPALSCTDTQTDLNYINNTLEPNVRKTIGDLINKKSAFASAGFQSVVCSDLRTLYTDTGNYGTALVNKACSSLKTAGNSARSKILADIQNGINAFC